MALVLVETTVNAAHARALATRLVRERLAACANVAAVDSVYWWRGRLERARERLVSFKTTRGRAAALVRRLRALHPHDVPYIAQLRLSVADPRYGAWVRASVKARRVR